MAEPTKEELAAQEAKAKEEAAKKLASIPTPKTGDYLVICDKKIFDAKGVPLKPIMGAKGLFYSSQDREVKALLDYAVSIGLLSVVK